MNKLKKVGHFALGFFAGWNWKHPASINCTAIMVSYQGLEAFKIRDAGFHELWQYGFGFLVGGVSGWVYRWVKSHENTAIGQSESETGTTSRVRVRTERET